MIFKIIKKMKDSNYNVRIIKISFFISKRTIKSQSRHKHYPCIYICIWPHFSYSQNFGSGPPPIISPISHLACLPPSFLLQSQNSNKTKESKESFESLRGLKVAIVTSHLHRHPPLPAGACCRLLSILSSPHVLRSTLPVYSLFSLLFSHLAFALLISFPFSPLYLPDCHPLRPLHSISYIYRHTHIAVYIIPPSQYKQPLFLSLHIHTHTHTSTKGKMYGP